MPDITISDNDPVCITPMRAWRRKASFRSKLILSLCVISAVTVGITYYDHKQQSFLSTHEEKLLSEYPKFIEEEDPEVKILAAYQKARYSTIAAEIAELQAHVLVNAAKQHDLPITLVVGVVEQESMFNSGSLSSVKAAGLFQLYALEGIQIDPKKQHDLRYNADIGCRGLLIKYKKAKGDWSTALAFYSGHAEDYASNVYAKMSKYAMFRDKYKSSMEEVAQLSRQIQKEGVN